MKVLPVDDGHVAYCLGCEQSHLIPLNWQFNGDRDNPTFTPSLLIRYYHEPRKRDYICHSFITNGKWKYCGDSTHELAGQTVDMEDCD